MRAFATIAASSLFALAAGLAAPASAQSTNAQPAAGQAGEAVAEAPATDDIVVVGTFGESLKKAMDKKRDSPVVIEALSISDLNQLPDVSVADALSRLPGLAADRDPNNGAKSQISLRGMGPQLTLGTLNGRDLATPTPDRNIRYDQFPSELIGGATVYKSPMASILEGGVAGSIDLSTVRPLDFRADRLSVSLQGMYSEQGDQYAADKGVGYRGSISYIGRFADNTLGIALGYAGRKEPYGELRTQHASYDPGGYTDYNADGVNDKTTYQLNQFLRTGDDKRNGVVGVVEWRPSSAVHLTLDGLWSKVDIDGRINGVVADRVNQQFANTYTNPVVIGDHLVGATVTALPDAQSYGYELTVQDYAAIARRNDKLYAFGGNLVFSPEGRWTATVDVAYSHVDYTADYYELRASPVSVIGGAVVKRPGQSISYDGTKSPATFSANFDLTDPAINRPASLSLPFLQIGRDGIFSWKNDFVYDVGEGFLRAVRLGTRFVDRTKSNRSGSLNVTLAEANRPTLSGAQVQPYALGSYDGVQSGAAPRFLTFDFYDVANRYFGGLAAYQSTASQLASWQVTEQTMTGYGQVDFGAAGSALTGNIGVRAIHTDDRSAGVRLPSGASVVEPYGVDNSYTDILPSLNLTYKLGSQVQLRLGLAKTIARPAVEDLNPGQNIYDPGNGSAVQVYGGNPALEPFRANQADLGVEWYFGRNDYVALTGFYKDLKSYITTGQRPITIGNTAYQFFQPINGSGGYIRGFEATLQKQFTELPAPFDGLGFYGNYAFVDSDINVTRNFSEDTLGLVGLSKHTGTATLYYFRSGFEVRGSYNYRSSYANVVDGGGFETTGGAGYLDAQVSYEFVKGFSGVLQASNILNTPYETYLGNNRNERGRYAEYGRAYFAGLRANF